MKTKRVLIAFNLLLMAVLACNLPGGQVSDLAATITAQALVLQGSSSTPAPLNTPAATLTNTPSVPEVSVTSATNCRTGPSTAYDLVFSVNPGPTYQVVGKNTPTGYWIINNPTGGTCWLWNQYAVVSGNTSGLSEFPVPPTPTPRFTRTPKPTSTLTRTPTLTPLAPPPPPGGLSGTRDCAGAFRGITPIWVESVTLTWQDNANNEDGYRVYQNTNLLGSFPPNSTQYMITLRYQQGTGGALFDNFAVEAYNNAGSSKTSVDVGRCP
jgi:hypothetical protein